MTSFSHHGVKGMHWGQHKALVPSSAQIRNAASVTGKAVGKGAVTTAKAVGTAVSYAAHHKRMMAGAVLAVAILHDIGAAGLHAGKAGILIKAANNREAAYKAGKLAVRALSSEAAKINYAKLAKGAYKITTL